eukprot:CAMPEP_0184688642 /NCGR_PEP_ID=MMETSP0312-20130426/30212_1 /TAXON_ID=31354 /ORGANISM="Compsopogon coeruleus, Strain SAG 36.94" /LENGTH=381 /DNA_ID=CAMNT_0027145899 /DNA_START=1362 /DNA_END=2507 /DNA_ORIENTATION=-
MQAGTIAGLVPIAGFLIRQSIEADVVPRVLIAMGLSLFAYIATAWMIPLMTPLHIKADLFGMDLNKRGTPTGEVKIPEALGIVPGTIYIMVLCLLHLGNNDGLYTAALASVTFMILLGFADDVLDLKWRYKMVLPFFASLPLVVNYNGSTSVRLPVPGGSILGVPVPSVVDLGILYHIYMSMLSTFCSNAINILAGLNGLEAGQAFIIACFVLIHNALRLTGGYWGALEDARAVQRNLLVSIDIILPFIGVCGGLLKHNWHPSNVFVGDTFCYFAGMTFAMAAILGNYSKTLLLFFIPQLINFLYSVPQLIGIVPCPRHRLPRLNTETRKLEPIRSKLLFFIPQLINFLYSVPQLIGIVPCPRHRLPRYVAIPHERLESRY